MRHFERSILSETFFEIFSVRHFTEILRVRHFLRQFGRSLRLFSHLEKPTKKEQSRFALLRLVIRFIQNLIALHYEMMNWDAKLRAILHLPMGSILKA